MANYEESNWRSVGKSLSWRLFATATTIAIAYFITGELELAKKIGAVEFLSKFFIYFIHERLWNFIPFGKYKEKKSD